MSRFGVFGESTGLRFFRMILSYDGTAYAGWQIQRNARSIQAEVQAALHAVTGQEVHAIASGRTDAGVHACGQLVSFACSTKLPADVLRRALNANLPEDIVVIEVQDAPSGFHAIAHTVRKRYGYVIQDGPRRDVFVRQHAWFVPQRLDVPAMKQAASALVGRHDFASFQASGSNRVSTVRTIYCLEVERRPGDFLDRVHVAVEADGFLYNMVRIIVGTLVAVGRGRRPAEWVQQVLTSRDRRLAGMTAPPQGLYLLKVWHEGMTNDEIPNDERMTNVE